MCRFDQQPIKEVDKDFIHWNILVEPTQGTANSNFYYLNQNFFYLNLGKGLIELDGTFTGTNDEP